MTVASSLRVVHGPVTDRQTLALDWKLLEYHADANIFLSWQWIGIWLQVYQPTAFALRVYEGDILVGLGLMVEVKERRHGVLVSRCLRLHQTGHQHQDQIWIEYNGFLAKRGLEEEVASACLQYLCNHWDEWDELVIGAIEVGQAKQYAKASSLDMHVRWEAPCYGVDLEALRSADKEYLEHLSSNTRYQIRRAQRLYSKRGEVRLKRPASIEEALVVYSAIGPAHLKRWGSGKDESGFANPEFVKFHEEMINHHWEEGGIDLVTVYAGDEAIATFYNLVYHDTVYFYLGGLKVEEDNKLKPGLLGHSLCIEDYKQRGFKYYDFMGGEERYKTQLGNFHQGLVQVALQKNLWRFKLEKAARRARNQFLISPLKPKKPCSENRGKQSEPLPNAGWSVKTQEQE